MEELRKKLEEFVTYEEGENIRKKIRSLAIKNYKQRYTDAEHLGFMKRHTISTEVLHPQSGTHYYYQMFSCFTQHIYADTIEELFDIALGMENKLEELKQNK